MSKIDDLINKLCPNGVEYMYFNNVASYIRGVSYNKTKEINNGDEGYKLLRANNITLETNTLNFEEIKIIDYSVRVKENQYLKKNDILIFLIRFLFFVYANLRDVFLIFLFPDLFFLYQQDLL